MSDTLQEPRQSTRFTPAFLDEVRARTPLASLIGRDVRLERAGGLWRGCCPAHGERTPSFYVYPDHYHCYGCGIHGDAFRYLMDLHRRSFVDAVKELAAEAGMMPPIAGAAPRKPLAPLQAPPEETAPARADQAQAIWLGSQPVISDTPVENYLKNRGIDLRALGRAPRALRFHPSLYHRPSETRMPAMVAMVNDGAGNPVAVHRTWLEYAGGGWIKARVQDPKMTLGRYPGGSIRLWRGASRKSLKDAPPGDPVVIGEGIETCLSVARAVPELRVLSSVSGANLAAVDLPPQIGPVILLIDNDAARRTSRAAVEADQLKIQRIVNRWLERGFNVRLARSPEGKDFNDMLRGG